MKQITTFLWERYKKIVYGNILDRWKLEIEIPLIKIIHEWVSFENGYFFFKKFRSFFISKDIYNYSDDEKIYHEFSGNKIFLPDYLTNKVSLRLQALIGIIIVDSLSLYLSENISEKEFIVFSIIDKQKTSNVVVWFYSIFDGCTPIISEPFEESALNYLYIKKLSITEK